MAAAVPGARDGSTGLGKKKEGENLVNKGTDDLFNEIQTKVEWKRAPRNCPAIDFYGRAGGKRHSLQVTISRTHAFDAQVLQLDNNDPAIIQHFAANEHTVFVVSPEGRARLCQPITLPEGCEKLYEVRVKFRPR